MIYHRLVPVEFNHCDPAGIVFYPRYFEMTNSVAENFFREVVGQSYAAMMAAKQGVPTARLEADFHAPSRLGDVLDWRMTLAKVGGTSVGATLEAWAGAEKRLTVRLVLVFVTSDGGRPVPTRWPDEIRTKLTDFMETADAADLA